MTKSFNYHLNGTGWAEVYFASDTQYIRFEVSYLSDPLPDLFEGLYRLDNNKSNEEKIHFAEEPGEHSLVILRQDRDMIKIEIYWSDEWEDVSTKETRCEKKLVYADTDTIKNIIMVICKGIDRLLERLTVTEYKEKWHMFDFPTDRYRKLRELLN